MEIKPKNIVGLQSESNCKQKTCWLVSFSCQPLQISSLEISSDSTIIGLYARSFAAIYLFSVNWKCKKSLLRCRSSSYMSQCQKRLGNWHEFSKEPPIQSGTWAPALSGEAEGLELAQPGAEVAFREFVRQPSRRWSQALHNEAKSIGWNKSNWDSVRKNFSLWEQLSSHFKSKLWSYLIGLWLSRPNLR